MIKYIWQVIRRFFKWLFFWKRKPEVKTYKDLLEKILEPFTREQKKAAYSRWVAAFILDDQEDVKNQLKNCFEIFGVPETTKAQALILPLITKLMNFDQLCKLLFYDLIYSSWHLKSYQP